MNLTSRPARLDLEALQEGVNFLCEVDSHLALIYGELGLPPLWAREPGFPTLVHIILEQQVSLASARAAFTKLEQASGTITPERFLKFDDSELKVIGFSRQKAAYCRGLAGAILDGSLDLTALADMEDEAVHSRLVAVKGIGPWTADIYLLMVLLRPDSWPAGDLALAVALQEVKGLAARPSHQDLEHQALVWRPWRAVAARLLWFSYLSRRGMI